VGGGITVTITIDAIYNGPENSGNGGYCCGLFAQALQEQQSLAGDTVIEVTLRKPIPLDTDMKAEAHDEKLKFTDPDANLIAIARLNEKPLPAPITPPQLSATIEASKNYVGFDFHPYASCFVCGTERHQGDGLQIFPGRLNEQQVVVAPWQPFAALADDNGMIKKEFIWAALDCPSYYGVLLDTSRDNALLGRMSLQIFEQAISVNQQYIIAAWPEGSNGRKHYGIAALYSLEGKCLAIARGTWIKI
jgi:hypothetical protein